MSAYDDLFDTYWSGRAERSARKVVPLLIDLVRPSSVIDVGSGIGTWLSVFAELGVEDVTGVDGDWVPLSQLRIDPSRFVAADLTLPLETGRRYDLALSLEVGEHLPEAAAAVLVESLAALAPVVYFSAAAPGQGGSRHVNEQWPDFWAGLFARHGFRPVDAIRDRIWDDPDVEWWYSQNGLVYAHETVDLGERHPDPLRRVVHPRRHEEAKARRPTLPEAVADLRGALTRSARHHLRRRG